MESSTQHDPDEGLDDRRRDRGLIGVNSKVPIRDRAILADCSGVPRSVAVNS